MSKLFDDASLAMIPSAYKDGKLYSIRPTDGSGDFTFSRGSNLAATRVDVNGLIEKGRENRLLYSQDYTQSNWNKSNCTITSNYIANPIDGSVNAPNITIDQTAGSYEKTMTQSNLTFVSGNVYCVSVYMKAGSVSSDTLRILAYDGSQIYSSGSILLDDVAASGCKYEPANNGWNRFYFYFKANNSGLGYIYIFNYAYGQVTNAGTNLYLYGAQLELGTYPTDYIETGASTAQAGILEDMPRLDYSGGASCPALLLEPQRTNLIDHSEYLDGLLDVANGSVSYNTAVSPEGLTNSALYTEDSSTNAHYIDSNTFSFTSGVDYVISVFAKYNGRFLTIQGSSGRISSSYGTFNLQTGVVEEDNIGTASIENYGNGWYRCSLKVTATSTGNGVVTLLLNDSATGGRSRSYTGDGTSGLYYYGFQAESGSYPTSYIPTYGSSVTRSSDSCVATSVSNLIGQTQGSFFVDFVWNGLSNNVADNVIMSLGAQNYGVSSIAISNYNGSLYARVTNGISVDANIFALILVAGTRYKCLVTYTDNDVKFYVNGNLEGEDTSVSIPAVSDVYLQNNHPNSKQVNQSLTFPTILTSSEAIALTTI